MNDAVYDLNVNGTLSCTMMKRHNDHYRLFCIFVIFCWNSVLWTSFVWDRPLFMVCPMRAAFTVSYIPLIFSLRGCFQRWYFMRVVDPKFLYPIVTQHIKMAVFSNQVTELFNFRATLFLTDAWDFLASTCLRAS